LIKRWLSSLGVLAATIVICLLVLELGFRAVAGVPILAVADWRAARVIQSDVAGVTQYNELVGWDTKPGVKANWLNTIDFGIRKNFADDTQVRQNGILAIGDSFVAGSGVNDDETWPAQLEAIIHQPVINAGVGGWGIDQMNLRVKQLFDATKPKIVILGGQDQAILRLNYTSYGRPKPYYSLQGSELVLHNVPVPHIEGDPRHRFAARLKTAMSYSYVLDQVVGRAAPAWWYTDENNRFYQEPVSVDELGCALTKEVKKQADAIGYRVLYLVEHAGQQVATGEPSVFVTKFEACAQAAGLQIVDDFDALHAIASKGGIAALQREFNMEPTGEYGHMSISGNRLVAELVAQALQQNTQAATSR
jgi:lysophospholipase L1-like esterase